jgi:hypothetical protein
MEPQSSRKRPWEGNIPDDQQPKRQDRTAATPIVSHSRQTSPLPHEAGFYPHDRQILDQRRLPPLSTSSCNPSAESTRSYTGQGSTHAQLPLPPDDPRLRSRSLFNVLQRPDWQDHRHHTGMHSTPARLYVGALDRRAIREG